MSYALRFSGGAKREFDKLPKQIKTQIVPVLESAAANTRHEGVKKIQGLEDCYRVRKGEYRIQDNVLVVLVVRIGHRKDVYKSLLETTKMRL